jgi:ABC-type Fe3+/spermidine/putrescine transport system ATPase subunit
VSNGTPLPAPPGSGRATLAIRPERLRLMEAGGALRGTVRTATFVSGQMIYRVASESGHDVMAKEADSGRPRAVGAQVGISWNPDDVVVLSD